MRSNLINTQSTELIEMIGSVPDKILDNNGLYMRLKLVNAEQATDITRLNERILAIETELEAKTIQCKTLRCVTADSHHIYANKVLYLP
jgi:hypothetical protein